MNKDKIATEFAKMRPHIIKIMNEGKEEFAKWLNNNDSVALGKYHGHRRCLHLIAMLDDDVNNREDAAIAVRDLSMAGDGLSVSEMPEIRKAYTSTAR